MKSTVYLLLQSPLQKNLDQQKNLDPSYDFSKIPTPTPYPQNKGESHYHEAIWKPYLKYDIV